MRSILRGLAVLLFTVIVIAAIMILIVVTPPANIPSIETLLTNPPPTPEFMLFYTTKMTQNDFICVEVDLSDRVDETVDKLFIDTKFISFLLYSWSGPLVEGKENAMSACPLVELETGLHTATIVTGDGKVFSWVVEVSD